uniref:Acyl-CoA dehydrogenase n=1 Tax=Archaeoglobus fulgidus TaxID=2234 RepID=A0A7C3MBJ9_ARCFL
MQYNEVREIVKATSEFAKKEYDRDLLKAWKKGFELGYFNLDILSPAEIAAVFEGVFSANPNFGVPMLYFTVSQHIFGEFGSLAFQQEKIVTDFTYERYIMADDTVLLFLAEERYYTPELTELRIKKIINNVVSDIRPLLNLLLAARCVGTAKCALKTVLNYLKELRRAGYEEFNYCHCFEKLGEISAEIEASKLMLYHAASLLESSASNELFVEMVLWKAACTAVIAVDESTLIQEGFYNYKEDFKIEIFRNITELKHRNPARSSIYNLKISELFFPFTIRFYGHFPE